MYVCVCNAYCESHLREAVRMSNGNATVTVEQIYARLGNGPRCGRCLLHAKDLIKASLEETRAEQLT
jgi:bacterioferritin-associated ferredoxin